jgi:hypothetical protein
MAAAFAIQYQQIFLGITPKKAIKMTHFELFGEEFIKACRDRSLNEYLMLKTGEMKSSRARYIYDLISTLNFDDKEKIDIIVTEIINRVLHNTMRLFDESREFGIAEKSKIDPDNDLASSSDGLAGELYGENGWIAKYSKFPEE